MKNRLTKLEYIGMEAYLFVCPGCAETHMIPVSHTPEYAENCRKVGRNVVNWEFNHSLTRPTFSPSLLVRGKRSITDEEHARLMAGEKLNIPDFVCHSYIQGGLIQFLDDCTHSLKGQTVALADVDE